MRVLELRVGLGLRLGLGLRFGPMVKQLSGSSFT